MMSLLAERRVSFLGQFSSQSEILRRGALAPLTQNDMQTGFAYPC
jgi:hypothetical protein